MSDRERMPNIGFNPEIFRDHDFDSGSLGVLASVVHPFEKEGDFTVRVLREGETLSEFSLRVHGEASAQASEVDLSQVKTKELRHEVRPGGFVLFHASTGQGYSVLVHGREEQEAAFDSRRLERGDRFTVLILRPGLYSITNDESGGEGRVRVLYPEVGRRPYSVGEPERLVCSEGSFDRDNIEVGPGQGIIFECEAPSRIRVQLEEPEDRPTETTPPVRLVSPQRKITIKRRGRE